MNQVNGDKPEKLLGFTWNVPNALTLLRMVLVPVFVVIFLMHPHDQIWRLWATAAARRALRSRRDSMRCLHRQPRG